MEIFKEEPESQDEREEESFKYLLEDREPDLEHQSTKTHSENQVGGEDSGEPLDLDPLTAVPPDEPSPSLTNRLVITVANT